MRSSVQKERFHTANSRGLGLRVHGWDCGHGDADDPDGDEDGRARGPGQVGPVGTQDGDVSGTGMKLIPGKMSLVVFFGKSFGSSRNKGIGKGIYGMITFRGN